MINNAFIGTFYFVTIICLGSIYGFGWLSPLYFKDYGLRTPTIHYWLNESSEMMVILLTGNAAFLFVQLFRKVSYAYFATVIYLNVIVFLFALHFGYTIRPLFVNIEELGKGNGFAIYWYDFIPLYTVALFSPFHALTLWKINKK
jgi:hypothetical protein